IHAPLDTVSVYENEPDTVGVKTGLKTAGSLRKVSGLQLYIEPPDPFKVAFNPVHMVMSDPALAVREPETVTLTASFAEQPFISVPVTEYVIVTVGLAVGL